jgi:putative DNA primase/helicase
MQVSFDPDNVADVERVMILLGRRRPRGGDSTPLPRFLAACTRAAPGSRVSKVSLYELFVAWCRAEGERPWSTRALTWGMLERGFALGKSRFRYWAGIELTRSVADFSTPGGKPLKAAAEPAG